MSRSNGLMVATHAGSRIAQSTPHILVVDDDAEIRSLLAQYLEQFQLQTTVVADGRAMRRVLGSSQIDLVVLDIMLPGEDGLTLCRRLRAESRVPIVMLTARGDDVDRIVGLELGADDYLSKPFNPRELCVRIKGLLRRADESPYNRHSRGAYTYRFMGWALDITTRELENPLGERTPLSGAEFRLLSIFAENPNRVLTRSRLLELGPGREADPFDRSIDVCIGRLRQIFGDNARDPTLIKTVYGVGYILCALVTRSE